MRLALVLSGSLIWSADYNICGDIRKCLYFVNSMYHVYIQTVNLKLSFDEDTCIFDVGHEVDLHISMSDQD